ncbi:MAG TPA: hypothetical protein VIH87_08985 [Methylocella sp.]
MTKKTRRKIDAALKAKIALEAVREQATARAFDSNAGLDAEKAAQKTVENLYAKIGQLTVDGSTGSPRILRDARFAGSSG